jgi:hypothetical protein
MFDREPPEEGPGHKFPEGDLCTYPLDSRAIKFHFRGERDPAGRLAGDCSLNTRAVHGTRYFMPDAAHSSHGIAMARLFPFPGFLLETAGVIFIVYGLVTGKSMLVTLGAVMLGLGLVLTAFGLLILPRRSRTVDIPEKDPPDQYDPALLYSDRLVSIAEDAITFRHYSLPFGSPRRVEFSDIDHFTCETPTVTNGKYRIWGTGSFSAWYPLDSHRPERDRIFFATLTGKKMKIGFTVEDPEQVTAILSRKGLFVAGECL